MKRKYLIVFISTIFIIIGIFTTFFVIVNSNNNKQQKEIIELKEKINFLEEKSIIYEKNIKSLEEENKNNKLEYETKIEELENKNKTLKDNITDLTNELEEINNNLSSQININNELNNNIDSLELQAKFLSKQIDEIKGVVDYSLDGYNFLAIGNSITVHPICSYWWSESGMGASKKEHDFVHLTEKYLNNIYEEVYCYPINFTIWELEENDRYETLFKLDKYLSPSLDLITIQLSENIKDTTNLENDFNDLITYIKKTAINAKIIVIDDFWGANGKTDIKKNYCDDNGISFISLYPIRGNEDYICGLGTTVYDDEGNSHIIENEGVASHPGDEGMKYIYEKIVELI